MAEGNKERSFIMIKPDGVQRGLVGKIIERFESKGFKLVAMKLVHANEDLLKKHYSDLAARPFFPGLVKYMSSGPVVPMFWSPNSRSCPLCFVENKPGNCKAKTEILAATISRDQAKAFTMNSVELPKGPETIVVWEGLNVVKTGRQMLGATDPKDSAPGTIRGDFCIQVGRNIIHGSDSVDSAKKEISLWFPEKEIFNWQPASYSWVYEN